MYKCYLLYLFKDNSTHSITGNENSFQWFKIILQKSFHFVAWIEQKSLC